MPNSWRSWCRLCANETSGIDIFIKTQSCYDIADIIRKYLHITVTPDNGTPRTICEKCYKLLVNFVAFSERLVKVEAMYKSIVNNRANPADYATWKAQFNLIDYTTPSFDPEVRDPIADNKNAYTEFVAIGLKINQDNITEDSAEENPIAPQPALEMVTVGSDDHREGNMNSNDEYDINTDENYTSLKENESESSTRAEKAAITEKTPRKRGRKQHLPPFKCNKCDKVYMSQNQLRYHRSATHFSKEVPCQHCDKKFPSKFLARLHENRHLDREQKARVRCPQCDKTFTKSSNLNTHIRIIHHGERAFVCETCGKQCTTKGALKQHALTHDDERPFVCPSCPLRFKTFERLKTHKDSHDETQYPCPECGVVLNTKRTLRTHMVVHTDERKFTCDVCGSKFKRLKTLKTHMVIHTGLRPHVCPYCDKAFAKPWDCRGHVKKAHPQEVQDMASKEIQEEMSTV